MPRIIISEPGKTPQPYRLKTDRIVTKIGRSIDNDVVITTGSASTYHCKMKRVEGGFTLVDNNSTNGIKHKDTRYSIIDLVDGMTVQIGDDIDMEFTLTDEEKEILAGEDFEPQQKLSFPKSKEKPPVKDEEADEKEDEAEEEQDEEVAEDEIILKEAKTKKKSKNKSASKAKKKPDSKLKTNPDKPIASATSHAVYSKPNPGLSFVVFIVLAILFFTGGLIIRHYQDHRTFIFSK